MLRDSNILFNNRYLTLKELGCGGFGCTYLAIDTHMPSKPRCVVKQLTFETDDPEVYELVQTRFQREATILEILGNLSPQIPKLHACSQEGNNLYLVQDWIDGESLQEKFDRSGAFDEDEVNDLLAYLLPVLGVVHAKNVIHRDIKPANIMIRNEDQRPFLIDFGAVKEVVSATAGLYGDSQLTIFIGTPAFAPSEQRTGRPVFASDLYSLGLTAICLLTGKPPAWKETDLDTGRPVINKLRPGTWHGYAPNVSEQLKSVLDKAIQPSAADRYQTAREMQSALRLKRSSISLPTGNSKLGGLEQLSALAEKYNDIHETYKGQDTPNRRELMTGILNEMVKLSFNEETIDVMPYLHSDNWGMRLAAYAYIYTNPQFKFLPALIDSTQQASRQPFVQHRGIEAIGKILERHGPEAKATEAVTKLQTLHNNLSATTLRYAELSRILKTLEERPVENIEDQHIGQE
jgi:serine/threonine protein kinase